MKKQIIIIPIYKIQLTAEEVISLKQCFKILENHTIKFVAPNGLNILYYESILNIKIEVEFFNEEFFINIRGYNQLMLSIEFYERFKQYDYMLVYQLDCYVFKDELDYWCNKGYDYIGSPWLERSYYKKTRGEKLKFLLKRYLRKDKYSDKDILIYNTGNGGFSLRKISKFITVLKTTDQLILKQFEESDDSQSIFNEDVFWSFEAKNIKKPNYKIASKFALDHGADIGLRMNKGELPFGCHAWSKKYYYWEEYIKNENLNNFTI